MKTTLFGEQAREKLYAGVKTLYDAVKATMGAGGRNVMIGSDYNGPPHTTKDGVTVARAIVMNDPIEEMGARMIREAATNTANSSGDGTTTSTVLAHAIISGGMQMIKDNPTINVVEMKAGIDEAVRDAVRIIKSLSVAVDEKTDMLKQVATISANGDEYIASVVADTVKAIGKDGVITVNRGNHNTSEIIMTIADGMEFSQGACSTALFNDKDSTRCEMEDPYVLIVQADIVKFAEINPILQRIHDANKSKTIEKPRGLFIIAMDVVGEALATLVVNKMKGNILSCAVRAPGFGDMKRELLADIATLCGATVVSEQNGLKIETIPLSVLGTLKTVTSFKDKTIMVCSEANRTQIAARCAMLQGQIEATTIDGEKEQLRTRLARLSNGVAALSVGGHTEVEMGERRDRLDDAICAARSAVEEGVVAGGGYAYLECCNRMPSSFEDKKAEWTGSFNAGYDILIDALTQPNDHILTNAGVKLVDDIENKYPIGINVRTYKSVNFLEDGIIDPTKVVRVALENAASVAGTFLTTECVISPTFAKAT